MKVVITHLKAPWPLGAAVGAVVLLHVDTIPAVFGGKCAPAEDDAEQAFEWTPPELAPVEQIHVLAPSADDLQAARALQQAAEHEAAELRGQVERLTASLQAVTGERDNALADVESLKAAAKVKKGG